MLESLGWGKDSAPGRRCAVRARPPARVRRWPGTAPHGGAVVPGEALRWEGPASRLHGGMFWRSCGAESAGARRARGSRSAGVPQTVSARQVSRGALRRAAPPGAGEEDGSGQWGRTRRRGGGPRRGEPRPGGWSCAPWRGGGEAGERPWLLPPGVPRVTAAAAILPHTDPPQRRLTAASDVSAHGAGPPN